MATTTENDTAADIRMLGSTNTTVLKQEYDAYGAMLFTVVTVLVYGMSIVAFIAGHLRRRHHTKEEESQISKYLKRANEIRRQAVRDDVLKLRAQLLIGSEIVDKRNSERRKSRVQRAKQFIKNDINCVLLEGNRTPSAESIILPAVTKPPPSLESDVSQESTTVVPEKSSPVLSSDEVFFLPKIEVESIPDNSEDDNVPESRHFIQTHAGTVPRLSLHASLDQSVIDECPSQSVNTEQDSPEGSPDFNMSRMYRSRRRGGVLNVQF